MALSRKVGRFMILLVVFVAWNLGVLHCSTQQQPQHADVSLLDAIMLAESWTNATNISLPSTSALTLGHSYNECRGKERLIDILLDSQDGSSQETNSLFANKQSIQSTCQMLPTFQQIVDIYGKGPLIVGLETCQAYRDLMAANPLMDPMPRVAGLYHSGTNALAKTLELNLGHIRHYSEWNPYEVPWGKHIPASYRRINRFPLNNPDSAEHVLPIIIVRNPMDWMRSMCHESYDAKFIKRSRKDCPHLLRPGSATVKNIVHVSAHQTGFKYTDYYDSLADMWTTWHQQYLNNSAPRLLIRYEDMILYPQQLVQAIAECSGKPAKPEFQYYTNEARHFVKDDSSKQPSGETMLNAMVKLGEWDFMYWTMAEPSRSYALHALDPEILRLFHYPHLNAINLPVTKPLVSKSAMMALARRKRSRPRSSNQYTGSGLLQYASRTFSPILEWLSIRSPAALPSTQPTPSSRPVMERKFGEVLARRRERKSRLRAKLLDNRARLIPSVNMRLFRNKRSTTQATEGEA